jgi:hypothetical protein
VLVPDEPVDLPLHQPLQIEVVSTHPAGANGQHSGNAPSVEERRRRLRASAGALSGPVLSDEALRRENLYDDRAGE